MHPAVARTPYRSDLRLRRAGKRGYIGQVERARLAVIDCYFLSAARAAEYRAGDATSPHSRAAPEMVSVPPSLRHLPLTKPSIGTIAEITCEVDLTPFDERLSISGLSLRRAFQSLNRCNELIVCAGLSRLTERCALGYSTAYDYAKRRSAKTMKLKKKKMGLGAGTTSFALNKESVYVSLDLSNAMKLYFAIAEGVRRLNELDQRYAAAKQSGVNIYLHFPDGVPTGTSDDVRWTVNLYGEGGQRSFKGHE
jgi:hypothetical protein